MKNLSKDEAKVLMFILAYYVAKWESSKCSAADAAAEIRKIYVRLINNGNVWNRGEEDIIKISDVEIVKKVKKVIMEKGTEKEIMVVPDFDDDENGAVVERLDELFAGCDAEFWNEDNVMAKLARLVWTSKYSAKEALALYCDPNY